MKLKSLLFGEQSVTKVAGLFSTRTAAENAARHLQVDSGLGDDQVSVISPAEGRLSHNAALARAIEPEQQGIWVTIVRAHVTMGVIGLLMGLLLYAILMLVGNEALRSTPIIGLWAIAGFGAIFGLLAGGLLAMRPDHGRVIRVVRQGLRHGRWAVVAHPVSADQAHQAEEALRHDSLKMVRSL